MARRSTTGEPDATCHTAVSGPSQTTEARVSITVDIEDLPGVLDGLDPAAYVCTAGAEGGPKVVHAVLTVTDDGSLRATVGRGTVANVRGGSGVTLVVPGADAHEMSLLVDAAGEPDGDTALKLRPSAAVWHRSAHRVEQ